MKKLVAAVAGAVLLTQSVHIEAQAPGVRETVAQMQEEKNKCSGEVKEEIYYDSLELLAICVEAEAGNQSLEGKKMVVDVILNRVDDKDWPDTIEDVIAQYNQFSSFTNGAMDNVIEPSEETIMAVQQELKEKSYPELFYFTAGDYGKYGTRWKKVGDHYFCTR